MSSYICAKLFQRTKFPCSSIRSDVRKKCTKTGRGSKVRNIFQVPPLALSQTNISRCSKRHEASQKSSAAHARGKVREKFTQHPQSRPSLWNIERVQQYIHGTAQTYVSSKGSHRLILVMVQPKMKNHYHYLDCRHVTTRNSDIESKRDMKRNVIFELKVV